MFFVVVRVMDITKNILTKQMLDGLQKAAIELKWC